MSISKRPSPFSMFTRPRLKVSAPLGSSDILTPMLEPSYARPTFSSMNVRNSPQSAPKTLTSRRARCAAALMPISGVEACAALPVATMCAPLSVRVMSNFTSAVFAASTSFANSSSSQSTSAFALYGTALTTVPALKETIFLPTLPVTAKRNRPFSQWHTP